MKWSDRWGASVCILAAGCAPALDWRDVRPEGSAVRLQFPCRPASQQRPVPLAGTPRTLTLYVCSAGGATWGLAYADVGDPAQLGGALQDLARSAATNVGAAPAALQAASVPGATPHPDTRRGSLQGRLPEGEAVRMDILVFAHGTQVFQATALGPPAALAAAPTFFDSLAVRP